MTNPPFILYHVEGIVEALNRPNVHAFMHIPVQSGSDKVLSAMRREYTVAEFSHLADRLKAGVPDLFLLTDIISGFPAESEEDWQQTMALARKYRFHGLHLSQFYARPGTPAAASGCGSPGRRRTTARRSAGRSPSRGWWCRATTACWAAAPRCGSALPTASTWRARCSGTSGSGRARGPGAGARPPRKAPSFLPSPSLSWRFSLARGPTGRSKIPVTPRACARKK